MTLKKNRKKTSDGVVVGSNKAKRIRYQLILDKTREYGFVPALEMQRLTDVGRISVSRLWTRGYPDLKLKPIREVLEAEEKAEKGLARRLIAEKPIEDVSEPEAERIAVHIEAEIERAKIRASAARGRAVEAQGVELFRGNAIAIGALVAKLVKTMVVLPQHLEVSLAKHAADMEPDEILRVMKSAARVAKDSVEAMHRAMILHRLLLGEPTNIERLEVSGEMNEEEALRWLQRGALVVEKLDKFDDWGELKVIEGGKTG